MANLLKFSKEDMVKAEKLLREAGIPFDNDVNVFNEVAVADVDDFFEYSEDMIEEYHAEYFSKMDYETFKSELRRELLHVIIEGDSDFFKGTDGVTKEVEEFIENETFLREFRTDLDPQ